MAQENITVVRAAFEALREDREAALKFFHPGIEWKVRADIPDTDTFRGHDGLRRLLESFDEVVEGMWFEPQEFIDAGAQVAVLLRWGGSGRASGVAFEERNETWLFTVDGGMITRVREYANKADALEAAGIREPK